MNVWNPGSGKYEPSKQQFQIVADGSAIATNGQHQVILAADINSGGSVDLLMPDGQRLLSNPMGLSFFDTSSGKNVLIAEVTNCVGQLVSPNVVVYPNAFDTLKASLRYTYTKSGFSQDVLLHENPGSPADYGLNPETTLLEMYSEFHNPPDPRKTIQPVPDAPPDETLDFAQMQIGRGVAYVLDGTLEPVSVSKTWTRIEGRDFLIESVPYTAIQALLEQVQAKAGSAKKNHTAKGSFPERRKMVAQALKPRTKEKQVASIKPGRMDRRSAAVIDYQTINTSQTNYLFKGDSTYFITDAVNLSGTVIFEGGAVIKYDTNLTSALWVLDQVNCLATAYRPVVLTAKDDNSVGETISGSTGSPAPASYGYYGIVVATGSGANTSWAHLSFRYLRYAFHISRGNYHSLSHAQIVSCDRAVLIYAGGDVSLRNVLIDQATIAIEHGSGTARGEHLTVHRTTNLKFEPYGSKPFYLTNSILVGVTNVPTSTNSFLSVSSYVFTNDVPTIFQTVGAGRHYLADNTFRNIGSTTINSSLLADLKKTTTYPPLQTTAAISTPTSWSPQAQRDNDALDLGYHYDPLDYLINNVGLSSTLVMTNGVAVGVYGNYGINLTSTSGNLIGEGTPSNLNLMARYQTVQEGSYTPGGSPVALIYVSNTGSGAPAISLRFTDGPALGYPSADGPRKFLHNGNKAINASIQNCQLRGSTITANGYTSYYGVTVALTNNLVERGNLYITRSGDSSAVTTYLRNNLFWRTGFYLYYDYYSGASNPAWDIKDNLFDTCSITEGGTNYNYYIANSYNGYVNTTPLAYSGGNDQSLTNFVYATGTLGPWYQSSTNMINAGSRTADQAGLYHYTTQVSERKETNTTVDIGYHYVATGPSSDGLVGWWKLDDGTGTNALDSSGFGNYGTLLNGPTWISGILGGALSFDGANDYVEVPSSASLNITSAVTLCAWISQDALVSGNKEIIFKGADASNTSSRDNYGMRVTAYGKLSFVFRDAADTVFPTYETANPVIAAATTYHVAVVHTFGNGGATRIYLNGLSQSASWTQGTGNETPMTASKPLWLGSIQSSGVNVNFWNGDLDDVRVYNRALSATEIALLLNVVPCDTDGDGLADYFEDRNGTGGVDAGETDWQSASDLGLKVWITEPKSNSNIP